MRKVILITYEGIYSSPLIEACLNNKHLDVVRILKSGTIYANKKGLQGILYLLDKSSLFFIVPKFLENMLFYFYRMVVPASKRPFKTLRELEKEYGVAVEIVGDINEYPHHRHAGMVLVSSYFNQVISLSNINKD